MEPRFNLGANEFGAKFGKRFPNRRAAFSEHMVATLTGGALTMLVSICYRLGLFEAAACGAATAHGLTWRSASSMAAG